MARHSRKTSFRHQLVPAILQYARRTDLTPKMLKGRCSSTKEAGGDESIALVLDGVHHLHNLRLEAFVSPNTDGRRYYYIMSRMKSSCRVTLACNAVKQARMVALFVIKW